MAPPKLRNPEGGRSVKMQKAEAMHAFAVAKFEEMRELAEATAKAADDEDAGEDSQDAEDAASESPHLFGDGSGSESDDDAADGMQAGKPENGLPPHHDGTGQGQASHPEAPPGNDDPAPACHSADTAQQIIQAKASASAPAEDALEAELAREMDLELGASPDSDSEYVKKWGNLAHDSSKRDIVMDMEEDEFDSLVDLIKSHSLFPEHCRCVNEEIGETGDGDGDWVFASVDGDPLEDVMGWLEWLAAKKPARKAGRGGRWGMDFSHF